MVKFFLEILYHGVMSKRLSLKPLDFLAFTLSLGLTVFSAWAIYAKPATAAHVIVQGEDGTWVFPLDTGNLQESLRLSGPIGETVVEIGEGQAWVRSSPCTNQTCVAAGHLRRRGQWTACLPNKVFIYIEGTVDENEILDSTTW
ncbi:hypothetical protein AGMMS49940_12670 [Spirochaetia bacterium]|nr:hypothetical protein AGMMS49940_12670 [Spirochaetia bacterium]